MVLGIVTGTVVCGAGPPRAGLAPASGEWLPAGSARTPPGNWTAKRAGGVVARGWFLSQNRNEFFGESRHAVHNVVLRALRSFG